MSTVCRPVVGLAAGIVFVAAVVCGCADAPVAGPAGTTPLAPPPASTTGSGPVPVVDQHAADVTFAQMVLPHVSQGLELTALPPGRAADPDLARLAFTMDYADIEEQGQLIGQLRTWSAPVPGERGVPSGRMPGMADDTTLARLRTLTGSEFDSAWLVVMIDHHQGAIDMSRDYLARSTSPTLAGVARAQIEVGQRQIDQMRALQRRV